MKQASYFTVVFGLLILVNSCNSPVSNSAVPTINEVRPAPTISNEQPEQKFVEIEFILIEIQKNSPIQILSVKPVNGNVKNGLDVELKNISDKTIRSVWVALTQPLNCAETLMSADLGTNQSNNNKNTEIQPSEISVFQVPPEITKIQMANRKCTKLSPQESTKSMIYIGQVDFSDNSNWSEFSKIEDQ